MITVQEMRELENESGVPVINLMENAGKAIAEVIKSKYDLKGKKILIACYHGNNGGDGLVAARYLCDDCEVDLLFLGDDSKLKKEALTNLKKVEENNKIQFVNFDIDFDDYYIILDAILGTGVIGELRDPLRTIITRINESKAIKISVDIPSGINLDNSENTDVFVNSDMVIALHDIKAGTEKFKDKTVIVEIGINLVT